MGRLRVVVSTLWVLSALECAGGPPEPKANSAPRTQADAGVATAIIVDSGTDADAATADAAAAETSPLLPKIDLVLHTMAHGDLKLAPLENTMLAHGYHEVARLVGRDLIPERQLLRSNAPYTQWFSTLGGRWPDAVYIGIHESNQTDRSFPGALLYRWQRGSWTLLHPNKQQYTYYAGLVPWGRSGVIGTIRLEMGSKRYEVAVADRRYSAPFTPTPDADCETRIDGVAFTTLPGSLLVAGPECKSGAPAIERFETGRRAGVVENLPLPDGAWVSLKAIHASGPAEIYVGGSKQPKGLKDQTPYLARYDGKSWNFLNLPVAGEITSIQSVEGKLWITVGGRLVTGGEKGWSEARLPEGFVARRVVIRTRDDIWVEGKSAILRSLAPEHLLSW